MRRWPLNLTALNNGSCSDLMAQSRNALLTVVFGWVAVESNQFNKPS